MLPEVLGIPVVEKSAVTPRASAMVSKGTTTCSPRTACNGDHLCLPGKIARRIPFLLHTNLQLPCINMFRRSICKVVHSWNVWAFSDFTPGLVLDAPGRLLSQTLQQARNRTCCSRPNNLPSAPPEVPHLFASASHVPAVGPQPFVDGLGLYILQHVTEWRTHTLICFSSTWPSICLCLRLCH